MYIRKNINLENSGKANVMITTKEKKVCFVITPIGDNNSDIRRHIEGIIDQAIEPALGKKYDIVVAHRKYEIGSINDRVIKSVFESDLVIANLTSINPNVMYELAIRYSFGKPAIVIAEAGTKLPFDVIDENTIFYINDPAGANDLKQAIIEYEKNINFDKKEYGPVYKVIKRIPLYNEVESGTPVSNDKALQYVIERLDSLEKNINLKAQLTSDNFLDQNGNRRVSIIFNQDKKFTDKETDEILDIFLKYDIREFYTRNVENIFEVKFDSQEKNLMRIVEDVNDFVNMKENLRYRVSLER